MKKQIFTIDGIEFELISRQIRSNCIVYRYVHRFGNGLKFKLLTLQLLSPSTKFDGVTICKCNRKLAERFYIPINDVATTFSVMKAWVRGQALIEMEFQEDILEATK